MRRFAQALMLRGCRLLPAAMLCGVCHAAPIPDATLQEMRTAAEEDVAKQMSPDQICSQLRRQFGYMVFGRSGFGDKGTDILVSVGSGLNVTFLATIGRVPYCGATCPDGHQLPLRPGATTSASPPRKPARHGRRPDR
ncbi:hypothetical protein LPN04_09865 [Rugamonas sp. A1-17]|nr:hypothetical protein [Rugamonas sp. A1-17]